MRAMRAEAIGGMRIRGRKFVPAVLALLLAACGGGGGDGGGGGNPPPSGSAAISGVVTYQKVPFGTAPASGLNYAATVNAPVRGALVEAVDSTDNTTIRASTTTDAAGNYTMQVGTGRSIFVRVKAQLLRASAGAGTAAWDFRVVNNTNGNALYALDGTAFTVGTSATTVNLNAASGWNGTSYAGTRAAAPFSLLDVAYEMLNLVLTANANAQFPALRIGWSPQNRSSDPQDFDPAVGNIVTTSYGGVGGGVLVLGQAGVDTDEYDQHVIAHELGHYFQDVFSRDDSVGGAHSVGERLDMRVAFSEGWGNAFSGMVKGDSIYRDSFGAAQGADFQIDVERNTGIPNPGWFNEGSIQALIYDFFDTPADGSDAVALGFVPVFQVMNTDLTALEPPTTIFAFVRALKARNPGSAAGIDTLVSQQGIVSATIDDYGSTETNNGGAAANLPVYGTVTPNTAPLQVCSATANGEYNKLGNRRFLRFSVSTNTNMQFRATGPVGTSDVDLVLHRQGEIDRSESPSLDGVEQFSRALTPGAYVLEVYDFNAVDDDNATAGNTCMNVTLTTTL